MKRLVLIALLFSACDSADDPPDNGCLSIQKRGYAGVETSTGTRLWGEELPFGEQATWRMEVVADTTCGASARFDFFDSRREGVVASFLVHVNENADGEVDAVWAGPGVTGGELALGGDPESSYSGNFEAVVNGEEIFGLFDQVRNSGSACVGESSLAELEFVAAALDEPLGGEIVQCDQQDPAAAADCVEAALAAGDGFSTSWQDETGLHGYVGTPGGASRFEFTPTNIEIGALATTSGCQTFTRAETCTGGDCWSCAGQPPLLMCAEASPEIDN